LNRTFEPNLPGISEAEASPEVVRLYAEFRETFGRPKVPAILTCFATHPPLLEHMMGLAKSMLFSDGALGRMNKEMIATFVSARNNCEYCVDSHGYALRMSGGSADMLGAVQACELHSDSIDPAQAALLAFVHKLTNDSQSIVPIDVETLGAAGWSDLQIAETIHLTALFACFNRVVNAFGLASPGMLATMGEPL
jgi:uncharacterized peroxidase-related enzyme